MHPTKANIFVKHTAPTFFPHLWCMDIWYSGSNLVFPFQCSSVFCYMLKQNLQEIRPLNDLFVFLFCMCCIGGTSPVTNSVSVTVIPLLSMAPFRATCFEFFSTIVTFTVGTYFDDVWSTLIINSLGMLYVTTESTVRHTYCVRTSNHTELVIVGRNVVAILRYRFMCL